MSRNLVRSSPSGLRLMDLENTLRMTDHLALIRDGIHFNTAQGRRWINDAFQTKIEEMEQELRTNDSLARTSSTGEGRVRGNVPEPLANRLGPLAMETGATAPVSPGSDVRERLRTAPLPRIQPLESRLGRPFDQSHTSSQTVSRTSNPPATVPAPTGSPSTSATPAEGIAPNSVLLWNRPNLRQRLFTRNVVKIIFVLSPRYATLPEPLQFVYKIVTTLAGGRFNVIIPARNRIVDPNNYYPLYSELPAIWADISNAIQGFKDCSTTRVMLNEVLGLELSNFARLLKLRSRVDGDHLLVQ